MRTFIIALGTIALGTGGIATAATTTATTSTTTKAFKGAELMPMAKVTLATATATALKARPGTITDSELEKEKGGSGLRYSFDITASAKKFEVGVDAKTGKVLENKAEGKNPD
jgi:uncharacterized membrane protein YkoI